MVEKTAGGAGVQVAGASTVMLVRDGASGVETFCLKRAKALRFLGGAVVFPGGRVEPSDERFPPELIGKQADSRSSQFGATLQEAKGYVVAAARECLEEAAVIPVIGASGSHEKPRAWREELVAGKSLAEVLADAGFVLDLSALIPVARWVTPKEQQRRFDTRFFILPLPPDQEPLHDGGETVEGFWAAPGQVIARYLQGSLEIVAPTLRMLEICSRCASVHALCRLAAHQSLIPVCPELVYEGGNEHLALPGDKSHTETNRQVLGPTRFIFQNGRLVSAPDTPSSWLPIR